MTRRSAFRRFLSLAVLLVGSASVAAAQEYKVVAHPDVPESRLSRDALSRVFLKKTTDWSDGTAIVPVDQDSASKPREAFSQDVHGRDTRAITAYWQKRLFSGRGVPPLVKQNDALVLEYVRVNPGAVGYVSPGASTEGVKVIRVE